MPLRVGLQGWVKLDEKAGTGASGILTFSAIPATYRDLMIVLVGRSDAALTAVTPRLTFEASPTAGAYDHAYLYMATALTAAGVENVGTTDSIALGEVPAANSTASLYGQIIAEILEYANTSMFKMVTARSSGIVTLATGSFRPSQTGGVYEATAAITTAIITASTGNWTTATKARLYGLAA